MVLICISLMTKDADHLFLLAICIPSWRNVFQVLCSFFNYTGFLMLSFRSSLHILDIKSLSGM